MTSSYHVFFHFFIRTRSFSIDKILVLSILVIVRFYSIAYIKISNFKCLYLMMVVVGWRILYHVTFFKRNTLFYFDSASNGHVFLEILQVTVIVKHILPMKTKDTL